MCILFIAVKQHPDYPLIILANRDEFHQRATTACDYWPEQPAVLGGRDQVANGSWMAVNTQNGRLAALTNIRDPHHINPDAPSRGALVSDFVCGNQSATDYQQHLNTHRQQYNGYNLLFGDVHHLQVLNSYSGQVTSLTPGVYGLSNAALNSPWPKLNKGVQALKGYCQQPGKLDNHHLFSLLKDQQQAPDNTLPVTGVSLEWERRLSSIFIQSAEYGTRSSTLLLMNSQQHIDYIERSFAADGKTVESRTFAFTLN